MPKLLKQKELSLLKKKILQDKEGVCSLCQRPYRHFKEENIVIDHDHDTGLIRDLLCRTCNAQEGHINAVLERWCKSKNLAEKLRTLKTAIAVINKSSKPTGAPLSILKYVYKTLGSGRDKRDYLEWLNRLGHYWLHHAKHPSSYMYARPETLKEKKGAGKNVKKRVSSSKRGAKT